MVGTAPRRGRIAVYLKGRERAAMVVEGDGHHHSQHHQKPTRGGFLKSFGKGDTGPRTKKGLTFGGAISDGQEGSLLLVRKRWADALPPPPRTCINLLGD